MFDWLFRRKSKPEPERLEITGIVYKAEGWWLVITGDKGSHFKIFMPKVHYYSGYVYADPVCGAEVRREYLDVIGLWLWAVRLGDVWATFPYMPLYHSEAMSGG